MIRWFFFLFFLLFAMTVFYCLYINFMMLLKYCVTTTDIIVFTFSTSICINKHVWFEASSKNHSLCPKTLKIWVVYWKQINNMFKCMETMSKKVLGCQSEYFWKMNIFEDWGTGLFQAYFFISYNYLNNSTVNQLWMVIV